MLASTLSCTLVSQTTKWQIFLTRYLFSPWKLSSHTKCWMRNFIRCPSQFLISCAYPSLSRVLPKKKQCNLTFSSEPQQLNPRNGPSHCHQKPPVRSLKQDLCLLIREAPFSTEIQPIASKSWDTIQNRFSNFCALLSTKGSTQSWEKRKSQELIPQSAWDWLHVLSLDAAARSQAQDPASAHCSTAHEHQPSISSSSFNAFGTI